jgi:His-Xaa-Ser system protein HxsD
VVHEPESESLMASTLIFDESTVTLDAVQRAAYALAGCATVNVRAVDGGWACDVHPRDGFEPHEVEHRLRNEVIDQVLRARIAAETEPVRNLVLALAFSRTGLSGEPREES